MHWNANKRKVSLFISRFRFQLSSSNMLWWKLYYHWRCKWCDLTHTKQSDTDTAYDCVIWTKMRHKCRWVCRLDIDISYYYLWTIFYIIGIKQTQEREREGGGGVEEAEGEWRLQHLAWNQLKLSNDNSVEWQTRFPSCDSRFLFNLYTHYWPFSFSLQFLFIICTEYLIFHCFIRV